MKPFLETITKFNCGHCEECPVNSGAVMTKQPRLKITGFVHGKTHCFKSHMNGFDSLLSLTPAATVGDVKNKRFRRGGSQTRPYHCRTRRGFSEATSCTRNE